MGAKRWKDKNGIEMTGKEMEFIRLYCFGERGVKNNATESYLRAFHEGRTNIKRECIAVYASELMRKANVKDAIQKNLSVYDENWVKQGLAEEAMREENKAADRIRARELVGKTMGLFVDRVENEVKVDGILINNDEKL